MGRLTDILAGSSSDGDFNHLWSSAPIADDFSPLPSGCFECRLEMAELFQSNGKGTPGIRLQFLIIEGKFTNRKLWLELWLTPPALPMTKRELSKIGITEPSQLEQPLPPGIRCKVDVALRKNDDGSTFNRVVRFEVIGFDSPEPDPFAPAEQVDASTDEAAADEAASGSKQPGIAMEGGENVTP